MRKPAAGSLLAGAAGPPVAASGGGVVLLAKETRQATYSYRTVSFSVPFDWWVEFLFHEWRVCAADDSTYSYGSCPSAADTLDALWSDFRSAAVGKHSTFEGMLGCFDIPYDYLECGSAFWSYGPGAPAKILFYAMQMIATYTGFIEYQPKEMVPSGYSQGFARFVADLLTGGDVRAATGVDCRLRLLFRNKGGVSTVSNSLCTGESANCSKWTDDRVAGKNWNAVSTSWDDSANCIVGEGATSTCGPPDPRVTGDTVDDFYAFTTHYWDFSVISHPTRQAFRGQVADYEMSLARMALSYGLEAWFAGSLVEAKALLDAASELARYALGVVLDLAAGILHELGHVYRKDAHSAQDNFAEVCARSFRCKVRGRLGLPMYSYAPRGKDDWAPLDSVEDSTDSSLRPSGSGVDDLAFVYRCDTTENGSSGEVAEYCASGALLNIANTGWYYNAFLSIDRLGRSDSGVRVSSLPTFCSEP